MISRLIKISYLESIKRTKRLYSIDPVHCGSASRNISSTSSCVSFSPKLVMMCLNCIQTQQKLTTDLTGQTSEWAHLCCWHPTALLFVKDPKCLEQFFFRYGFLHVGMLIRISRTLSLKLHAFLPLNSFSSILRIVLRRVFLSYTSP